jgi:uncharacterized protein YdaT
MKLPIILSAAICAVFASLIFAGCSSKPVDELDMAGVAMNNARAVEASTYAPKDWDRAQAQWQEANALIHMGRYSEARNVLISAIASYNDAQASAKEAIENLQIEIKAQQSTADMELKKIEKGCENPKLKPSVRRRVEASLPSLDEKISDIKAEFEAKEFTTARMEGRELARYMTDLEVKLGIRK